MAGYCLDTSIVVDIFRGDVSITRKVDKIRESNDIYLSCITVCELFKGAYLHSDSKEKSLEVKDFISYFEIIGFDEASCEAFGMIFKNLKKKGKMIPEFDIMIAAIAKACDLILITKDKRHFENTGVKVEVWN